MGNKGNVKTPIISTTLITFYRLDYTRRTIESYLNNTSVPYELIVVDNGSTDGTVKYLEELGKAKRIKAVIANSINKFPGFATNQGWSHSNPKAQYLHRSDNDLEYKKGWDKEVIQAFKDFPEMGQLGLINELYQLLPKDHATHLKRAIREGKSEVMPSPNSFGNVGGPCVIRADIFRKQNIRWNEDPWTRTGKLNEDYMYSTMIKNSGWKVYELLSDKVTHTGFGDTKKYYTYYFKTYRDRNLDDWFKYRLEMEKVGRIKKGKVIK